MLIEIGVLLLVVVAFALLAPRAGVIVGPAMIVIGLAPVVILFMLPAASQARANEHYGMFATLAFLILIPAGIVVTLFSVLSNRR
jgi:hypothetical protein